MQRSINRKCLSMLGCEAASCSEQDLKLYLPSLRTHTRPFLSSDPQAPFYCFVFCTFHSPHFPHLLPPLPQKLLPLGGRPRAAPPCPPGRFSLSRNREPQRPLSPLLCSGGRGCIRLALSARPPRGVSPVTCGVLVEDHTLLPSL